MAKALKERRSQDVDDYQERLGILQAAEGWQIPRVRKANMADLVKHASIITPVTTVPFCNRVLLTQRVSIEHLRSGGDFKQWLSSVWPWDEADPPTPWECSAPTFAALIHEFEENGKARRVRLFLGELLSQGSSL